MACVELGPSLVGQVVAVGEIVLRKQKVPLVAGKMVDVVGKVVFVGVAVVHNFVGLEFVEVLRTGVVAADFEIAGVDVVAVVGLVEVDVVAAGVVVDGAVLGGRELRLHCS